MRAGRLFVALAAAVAALAAATGAPAASRQAVSVAHVQPVGIEAVACKRDYYKNVSGNCVHRPSSSPTGATARCADGTYSYSQHASGTCSHHGGVARWIHHP
jgi:hypothetical protein